MKTHAIIPIFVPHAGCPHDCIFCNQKSITAHLKSPSYDDSIEVIERNLSTISSNQNIRTVELAFYGGSFTAIPTEVQNMYLDIAADYKAQGKVNKIHLSTRPDCIDEKILANLKAHSVDIIELGVQSFDPDVLHLSARGHDVQTVYESSELIKAYGFTLGIQLMIGLPGDSYASCMDSVRQTISIQPSIARLYPTVVIKDTALAELYRKGSYIPFTEEQAVSITKDMYKALTDAGINVIRIGLKSTANIREGGDAVAGNYHPAFRQLVEGELAKDELEFQLKKILSDKDAIKKNTFDTALSEAESNSNMSKMPTYSHRKSRDFYMDVQHRRFNFLSAPESFSSMVGNSSANKRYFAEHYPDLKIKFAVDRSLAKNEFVVMEI